MSLEPINVLKKIPLFAHFSKEVLAEVKDMLIRKHFNKNDVVFNEQDEGQELYIVRSGQFKIVTTSPDGGEIILAILTPGDFFGELSVLDKQPRSAMAMPTAMVPVPHWNSQGMEDVDSLSLWNRGKRRTWPGPSGFISYSMLYRPS